MGGCQQARRSGAGPVPLGTNGRRALKPLASAGRRAIHSADSGRHSAHRIYPDLPVCNVVAGTTIWKTCQRTLHRADRPGFDRQFLKWADRPTEAFTATSTAVPSRGQSLTHGLDQLEDVGTSFLRLVPLGEVLQRLDHPLVAEVHQLLDRQQVWMR